MLSSFNVQVDKKGNSWSGSVEVGITSTDPDDLSRIHPFPSSANELRQGNCFLSLPLLGVQTKTNFVGKLIL